MDHPNPNLHISAYLYGHDQSDYYQIIANFSVNDFLTQRNCNVTDMENMGKFMRQSDGGIMDHLRLLWTTSETHPPTPIKYRCDIGM